MLNNRDRLTPLQQPCWPDDTEIARVRSELEHKPLLARPREIDDLSRSLAQVAAGGAFLIQGGPCAESFTQTIEETFDLVAALEGINLAINMRSMMPTVTVPRIAGQFCKPRSSDTETINGVTLPSFRGELVNEPLFNKAARKPNPERLLHGYKHAHDTLDEFRLMSREQPFTAHEALLMDYELPQVHHFKDRGLYGTSGHFLWIGDRTKGPNSIHVAFCEMIKNPVGVKIGPGTTPEAVVQLCEQLNPQRQLGRLSLITRFGAEHINRELPSVIEAVKANNHEVIWVIDPMHGNTVSTPSGKKTRHFDVVSDEVEQFFKICTRQGVWPGGIHLEMSGQPVTECLGGGVTSLDKKYTTLCDPRLNSDQAGQVGAQVAGLIADVR